MAANIHHGMNPVFCFNSSSRQAVIPFQVIGGQWTFFPTPTSHSPAHYYTHNYNIDQIIYGPPPPPPIPLPFYQDFRPHISPSLRVVHRSWVQQDETLILDGDSTNIRLPPRPRHGGPPMKAMMVVKNLKTKSCCHVEASDGDGVSKICAVCQEDLCCDDDKEEIGVLDCRHEYHARCIRTWLLIKNVCPLCNATAVKVP